MAKAIHSMIRVLDEDRSVAFYNKAFGLKVADRLDFPTNSRLSICSNAETGFEVELTVNKGRTEPYDLGDGYGHLAVSVEDLDAEHARFEAEGLGPANSSNSRRAGTLIATLLFRGRSGRIPDRGAGTLGAASSEITVARSRARRRIAPGQNRSQGGTRDDHYTR